MTLEEFENRIQLKDTVFDRRRKLSISDIENIKKLYKEEDLTQKEIADIYKVSDRTISYHLSDTAKEKNAINKRAYYYKQSREKRSEKQRQYNLSRQTYIKSLFEAMECNR